MFAVAVDDVDFWEEAATSGRQSPQRPAVEQDRMTRADNGCRGRIDWLGPDDKILLVEDRTITRHRLNREGIQASLIDWRSTFTPPPDKTSAEITGRAYFGLGARFVESIDRKTRLFNADDKEDVEGTNAAPSRWCALHAEADGKPVTFVMFDQPADNPRPAVWFTMVEPFTYMSATWDLDGEPVTVTDGKPVTAHYGVLAVDDHLSAVRINVLYEAWATHDGGADASGGTE
jgi:hypothetical protein